VSAPGGTSHTDSTDSADQRLAGLLSDLGDHPRAARLLAAAEQWREGGPRLDPERARAESAYAAARAALGPARYAVEQTEGAALTPADVLDELGEVPGTLPGTSRPVSRPTTSR